MVSTLMIITIGSSFLTASLYNNTSVDALKKLLEKNPLTIEMNDYGNMEKVGPIGTTLPRNDIQMNTGPGDIILYQGTNLVIYYSTNSWSLTPIGKINDIDQDELKRFLGEGQVTVTFSLKNEEVETQIDDDFTTSNEDFSSEFSNEHTTDDASDKDSNEESSDDFSSETNSNDDDKEDPENNKNSKAAVIAGTVSAAVVVGIIIIIIAICYCKKFACFGRKTGLSESEARD